MPAWIALPTNGADQEVGFIAQTVQMEKVWTQEKEPLRKTASGVSYYMTDVLLQKQNIIIYNYVSNICIFSKYTKIKSAFLLI